jgi:phage/plasmid-like protein (TIGR03299 family)
MRLPLNSSLISLDDRIGEKLETALDFEDMINKARLNFDVEKVQVLNPEGKVIPDHFLIRRVDNKVPLNIVRTRYTPVNTAEMLRPFDDVVKKYGLIYENAGIIADGAKCWVAARFPEEYALKYRPSDKLVNRIMCLITHDSSSRNSFFAINKRIFCNNQFSYIASKAKSSDAWIAHTVNYRNRLEKSTMNIDFMINAGKNFLDIANKLNDTFFSVNEATTFTEILFPDRNTPNKKRETERLQNRRDTVLHLFAQGKGNIGRTRWDMFNAVTEFMDHHNNTQKLDRYGRSAAEQRMTSNILGGQGDKIKQTALKLLLN